MQGKFGLSTVGLPVSRTPLEFALCASSFRVIYILRPPVGLDGDGEGNGEGGRSRTAGQALKGCLHVFVCLQTHMLTHPCVFVCASVWLVTAAYPLRIPMKLNQHFSFVFALALWALWRPLKDNSAFLVVKAEKLVILI